MIYEYACPTCKRIIEIKFPMGKQPKNIPCKCGKLMNRKYSTFAFITGKKSFTEISRENDLKAKFKQAKKERKKKVWKEFWKKLSP